MELWRRAACVAIWRYRGLQLWKRAVGVAIWRYEGMELQRRAAGVQTWTYRRYAGVVNGGMRYGALEARCRCSDVEVRRYGILETRCRRADVEVWSSGGALQAKLYMCMKV